MKICSIATLALLAAMTLAGCGNSDISKVKAMKLDIDPSYTVGQALGTRKVCDDESWDTFTDSRGRNIVEYRCVIKGITDIVMPPPNPVTKIAELYQWTIDAEGTPMMTFTGLENTRQDGTVFDQPFNPNALERVAIQDTAVNLIAWNTQVVQHQND